MRTEERRTNEKIKYDNVLRDSDDFVNGFRVESAGSVEESAAYGTHVRPAETRRNHPFAGRRLHGPPHGRPQGSAPIPFWRGRKEPSDCCTACGPADPRNP